MEDNVNYSCCYVLADNKDLQYFNQMMISISSLRYTGFTGSVYVVTDNDTANLLKSKCNELNELSAELVVVEIDGGYTTKEKSRYIKTSLRKYIQGDSLFVDTDTIFVSCPPEWISDDDFAISYDFNGLNDNASYLAHKEKFDRCGLDYLEDDHIFLNSGVIWMRDTEAVHIFFNEWHSLWRELLNRSGLPNDQISLNYLWKHGAITVHRLDDRFNVQVNQLYFSPCTLTKTIIIHYFNNIIIDPIFLGDPSVRKLDYRDESIQQIIQDPLSAISDCRWMKKDGITDEYLNTGLCRLGYYIFRNHRRLFSIFEYFCQWLRKIRENSTTANRNSPKNSHTLRKNDLEKMEL